MIRRKMNLIMSGFLLAVMCLTVGASESVESEPGSQPAATLLAEGIISTNDRLTVNVEDVDIAQLLRMLSVKRRVSIVAGPQVSGRVSVNLYDVTFEEALRSILDVSGYTATYRGDVILVTGALEKAQLPLDAADMQIRVFKLNYVDANEVFDLVEEFLSPAGKAVPSRSSVSSSASGTETITSFIGSMLLVQDTLPYLDRISSLLEQIDVPPRQVLIEARLLEIKYDDKLTVGVQVGGEQINGDTIFRALTSGFAADPSLIPQGAQGLFAAILTEDIYTFLEALEEETNVKILANPKILAVHGQPAELIIGDRLGFRITTTTQTSSLESVEFLDVGTQLEITPQISDDGLILLKIHPEVSSGSISAAGLPSESTAEATTYMLVRDGQTVVLGGLLKETTSESVIKVPLLGDIPVLGHLFRRTTKSKSRNELVVLITPHIVGPEPN
ncbi:MAG: secretin and TonB N-terminal domain-containing protein, partial [Candidatus Hydrogenedentes bacterium]|nr:secretin and TonB N-terminal domain-containing protein [Candidatus Hydrogenedentota bacterium]